MSKLPTTYLCIQWAMRSGLSVRFFTQRTPIQLFYCCTLESRIGNKIKTYEIKEHSLKSCLYHIVKNYKAIFLELNCPPLTVADILKE